MAAIRCAVDRHRNGSTSTGMTPTPSAFTSFDSSTTTTKRLAAAATSFSRNSAPPRPLMRLSAGSTSSAPSTARSICPTSSVTIGIPSDAASSAVARDVGTPRSFMPSATSEPTPSVKNRAVEPVPRPTSIPSWTSSTALAAAARFRSSINSVTDRLDPCCHASLVAVDRVAGDQDCGPGGGHQRRRARVDAAVDLDLEARAEGANAAHLVWAPGDELLAAKPGLDGHHVHEVDVGQDLT